MRELPTPFVPSGRGRAALLELDRVPWHELEHAYGKGVVEHVSGRHDVRASLARLGDRDVDAVHAATYGITGKLCHQGTIYEATAPAVPFLAAFVAGEEIWIGHARDVACIVGSIAISSSWETEDGTWSGSYGEDVAESTRMALRASADLLAAAAQLHPPLAELVTAIVALARTDSPKRAHLDAVADQVDALYEADFGEAPREPLPPPPDEWIEHAKFGRGLVVGRQDDKVRVRFDDGTERTLARRFVTPRER
jgi:hypothetical protein